MEIDRAAKLHEKLGFECETYVTMEAGDPTVDYPALEEEIDLCLLLPCNVAVDRKAGKTVVAAIDAERILSLTENSSLAESATDVNKRLQKALKSIG